MLKEQVAGSTSTRIHTWPNEVGVGWQHCLGIVWDPARETSSDAARQRPLIHSRLSSLSHYGLILTEKNGIGARELISTKKIISKKAKAGNYLSNLAQDPRMSGKSHHHHHRKTSPGTKPSWITAWTVLVRNSVFSMPFAVQFVLVCNLHQYEISCQYYSFRYDLSRYEACSTVDSGNKTVR